jgi:hypothetical protein
MAEPAASSDALFIFDPEDKRSIAVSSIAEDSDKERCAVKELTFVFTIKLMGPS